MNLNDYAKADFICSCGKRHRTDIKEIIIDDNLFSCLMDVIHRLFGFLNQTEEINAEVAQNQTILMVSDERTWEAAGKYLAVQLERAGMACRLMCFPAEPVLVPDEKAVFGVLNSMGPDIGLLMAVGSGTINDLTRFVSHRANVPYLIVATAPSMDGYASSVSSLVVNHMKQTFSAWGAEAIMAAPSILAACPQIMIAAGLGDILGKYTAISDWRLSNLITGEHFCETVANLVLDATHEVKQQSPMIALRETTAVTGIFEALIMTGIAMSYIGNSRPASGSEHHLSHYWEMSFLREGRPPVLHGSKVGLATLMTCELYRYLPKLKPDFQKARARAKCFDPDVWEKEMTCVYGEGAAEIIAIERKAGKHDSAAVLDHLDQMEAHWPEICELSCQTIPESSEILDVLRQAGGPVHPEMIGISRNLLADSLRYAMEIRDRYTILRLYDELGETETAVGLIDHLFFTDNRRNSGPEK